MTCRIIMAILRGIERIIRGCQKQLHKHSYMSQLRRNITALVQALVKEVLEISIFFLMSTLTLASPESHRFLAYAWHRRNLFTFQSWSSNPCFIFLSSFQSFIRKQSFTYKVYCNVTSSTSFCMTDSLF